jgi:DNA-binding FadR family transcriptional regulator
VLGPLPARPSATVAAERAVRAAILSGELAAGDRLPPERELSDRLGVSRLTLRAALATLSAAGLISVRQGSGYTVRDVRETGGADLLPGLVELATVRGSLPDAIADLLRLRRHLAGAVLDALVERPPSVAARKAVAVAVERFAAAADTGRPEVVAEADLGVVRALLDATGSMVLRVCLNPIVAIVGEHAALRAAIYSEPAANLAGWRALAAWLERPTAVAIPVLLGVLTERDRTTVLRLRRGARRPRGRKSR